MEAEHRLPERFRPQYIGEADMTPHRMGRKHRADGKTLDDCPFIGIGNILRWRAGWQEQDEIINRGEDK